MPGSPRARSQSRTRGSGRFYAPASGGGGGAFDPATLTGTALWLRAKDLGANGSTVMLATAYASSTTDPSSSSPPARPSSWSAVPTSDLG